LNQIANADTAYPPRDKALLVGRVYCIKVSFFFDLRLTWLVCLFELT